ncbi:hypothetical protein MES5069_760037 [Mesorhizobium escarrei]|uniref:WGR domain-containing protein n=1 Tax=Mesorhizobium escarrei TaxID=666018 RepID=A0ABN8KHL6_9HYPH|nr:hypothetical protein MES5069_760037 [Mesorhizobium escarrei]
MEAVDLSSPSDLGMVAQRYRLYIERMDTSRNMARFYAMSIDETLFGQTC